MIQMNMIHNPSAWHTRTWGNFSPPWRTEEPWFWNRKAKLNAALNIHALDHFTSQNIIFSEQTFYENGWHRIRNAFHIHGRAFHIHGRGFHFHGRAPIFTDDPFFKNHVHASFLAFLGQFRFWMGIIWVARWNGLESLIPKHMWKSKIGPLEAKWDKNQESTFF